MKDDNIKSAIFLILISIGVSIESLRIGVGRWSTPGPGFIPLLAATVLGGLALFLIINTLYRGSTSPVVKWYQEVLWKRWGISVAMMVAYAILLERVGFIICTVFLISGLVISIRPHSWKMAVVLAIVSAATSYFLFDVWLNVQLPKGLLGR